MARFTIMQTLLNCALNALRSDSMLFVMFPLNSSPIFGDIKKALNRISYYVAEKYTFTVNMPGRPPRRLNQACLVSKKTFLVSI